MIVALRRSPCALRRLSAAAAAADGPAAVRACGSYAGGKMEMFRRRLCAESVGRQFELSDDELRDVMLRMTYESPDAERWNTHVRFPPARNTAADACSRFLSVEMTDAERVHVRLTDLDRDPHVRSSAYPVSGDATAGRTGRGLFGVVGRCVARFADELGVRVDGLPLAFTFGFPVSQTAPGAATLRRCTKRLGCEDAVGRDVVAALRGSLHRAGVRAGPVTLFNDACAALLHGCAADGTAPARVGLVVDEGCNCCYADAGRGTVINTEWGAFGERGELDSFRNRYDRSLDARSQNPGQQIFEKLTSGMYAAELVREMVSDITVKGALFDGRLARHMFTEHRLRAEHLCRAERDERGAYAGGRSVLTGVMGACRPADFDCELFRYACECATKRSAHLIAAGLAGLLLRLVEPAAAAAAGPATGPGAAEVVAVAVSGVLFDAHPSYAATVARKTEELIDGRVPFAVRAADRVRGARVMAGVLAGSKRAAEPR